MLSCLAHPFISIILAPIIRREIVSLLRGFLNAWTPPHYPQCSHPGYKKNYQAAQIHRGKQCSSYYLVTLFSGNWLNSWKLLRCPCWQWGWGLKVKKQSVWGNVFPAWFSSHTWWQNEICKREWNGNINIAIMSEMPSWLAWGWNLVRLWRDEARKTIKMIPQCWWNPECGTGYRVCLRDRSKLHMCWLPSRNSFSPYFSPLLCVTQPDWKRKDVPGAFSGGKGSTPTTGQGLMLRIIHL